MSFNIILNSSNVVNSNNNQFRFKFINGAFNITEGSEMCVGEIQIPYSWFNISTNYNNNAFVITDWLGTVHNIILPNGFYLVSDIQQYLETYFINNGMYLIDAGGNNVYYFYFYDNTQYYRTQILLYPIPISLPTGYTLPTGFIGFPSTPTCMSFTILNNGFTIYSGFNAGTYGGGSTPLSLLSNNVPVGSTVNSLNISCSIIENPVSMPSNILDTIPINTTFGSNINYAPSFEKWIKLKSGTYSELILGFTDQNNNPLQANDPNVSISLLLKKK